MFSISISLDNLSVLTLKLHSSIIKDEAEVEMDSATSLVVSEIEDS